MTGHMDERGRLPPATAFATGRPFASTGAKEKSVSWLFRKKPSTMRPVPKIDSTVVVIQLTLPRLSTMVKSEVPPGSAVASRPRSSKPEVAGREPARGRTVADQLGAQAAS